VWRSEDEMLEVVQRRAAATRDRRRALLTGATAAMVLVTAVAVAAVWGDGGDRGSQELRVAAPAGGGRVAEPTTTLAVPPASIDSPPLSLTPAPAVPRPTTTRRPAAPAVTTTTTPAPPPPTTRPLPATCTDQEVQAAFAPSKTTFATGETIRLTAVFRNASDRECGYTTDGQHFSVKDASGNAIGADWGSSSHVDCIEGAEPCGYTWAAGTERSLPVCWDQRRPVEGTSVQVAPGRYSIGYTVTGRVTAPVTLTTTVEILPPLPGTTPPAASCWP